MSIHDGVVEAVGNTPLIKLRGPSEATKCNILGKAEFMNPGMSVKDRAALFMVNDAVKRGVLKPGGTIVEGTAGNTGIGLALVGRAKGFRTLIVIPETQTQEKKDMLRLAGAELVEVPAKPFKDDNNYVKVAQRLAEKLNREEPGSAFYANQWDNLANRQAHIEGTAPEIWRQTDGKVDGFICAIGTGGTLSGTGLALKEHNSSIAIGLADPPGACMFNYFTRGELTPNEGSSITQGIGQGRVTGNVDGTVVDKPYFIPDLEALEIVFALARDEGLVLGGSSGTNIAGAIRLAKDLGPGHTVVTILCDPGNRYQTQMWNPAFLASKGLPVPEWLAERAPRNLAGVLL
ncbi:MAG: cysteine synthase A [Myxococcota bacterium]